MKLFLHVIIICSLTILTQIGGFLWFVVYFAFSLRKQETLGYIKFSTFITVYLFSTFFIVPSIASKFGRVPLPIENNDNLVPHFTLTYIANRHYVKPKLKQELLNIASQINSINPNLKLSYLDANFPFIDGFPLLPHLSHKDGKKVDISLYYTLNGQVGNLKPSNSGYGKFVEPKSSEYNKTIDCKKKGFYQYDYSKYLTFGSRNDLAFDQENTKDMINLFIKNNEIHKILIEPHLKERLKLNSNKIRFQGCNSVRHDDHIHCQLE